MKRTKISRRGMSQLWEGGNKNKRKLEEEREGARKRVEHELKYSMLHPPRLLADNYTSRSYKELGRSKLKASKISFPSHGEEQRGEGSQACLSELENARFSPRCATVGNSWWRKKWREKEGGWLAITERLPATAARLIEHCNSTSEDLYSPFFLFLSRDFPWY